jgi:hypothetical protein
MISLTPTDASERELTDFLRRLEALGDPTPQAVGVVQAAIHDGFAAVFASEGAAGAAPWAELAEATRRERARLGYPPAHPILVRTGDYRASFVEPGHADHVSEWIAIDGTWLIEEGSSDYRAKYHEPGGDIIPRRSVTDLGAGAEDHIGQVLNGLFAGWFE